MEKQEKDGEREGKKREIERVRERDGEREGRARWRERR